MFVSRWANSAFMFAGGRGSLTRMKTLELGPSCEVGFLGLLELGGFVKVVKRLAEKKASFWLSYERSKRGGKE